MSEEFKAAGAVIVIAGVVVDEHGNALRNQVNIQLQGELEQLLGSQQGMRQAQRILLDAAQMVGDAMLQQPAEAAPSIPIVPAIALHGLKFPTGPRMN